ncbi:MAG: Gfo/Idh/MocA family oxidoreductase [Candidatus Latescibacteria bacterium]|nr:Gfo/Idh/MocA family oxidoreductase [Candidatus Latescibacterota bacterium]
MIRIGIVGSDNTHAERFSEITNLENPPKGLHVEGAKVVAIYGEQEGRTKQVAEHGQIPKIVKDPREMLNLVDAVMVVFRHGDKHYPYARPFIEEGIPTFIDKPLTLKVEEAERLVEFAEKSRTLLTSFSTLRYARNTVEFIEKTKEIAPLTAGVSAGPANAEEHRQYGGLPFYGIHAVELLLATFGYDVESVLATEKERNILASVKYRNGALVGLYFLGNADYVFHLVTYGKGGHLEHVVDASTCYADGLRVFLKMIETGEPPLSGKELIAPVRVLNAVQRSLSAGKEIGIWEREGGNMSGD